MLSDTKKSSLVKQLMNLDKHKRSENISNTKSNIAKEEVAAATKRTASRNSNNKTKLALNSFAKDPQTMRIPKGNFTAKSSVVSTNKFQANSP